MEDHKTMLNVKYIKALLQSKGMAVKQLAYRMGRSPKLVQEQLDNEMVKLSFAMQMADALNVELLEIVMAY